MPHRSYYVGPKKVRIDQGLDPGAHPPSIDPDVKTPPVDEIVLDFANGNHRQDHGDLGATVDDREASDDQPRPWPDYVSAPDPPGKLPPTRDPLTADLPSIAAITPTQSRTRPTSGRTPSSELDVKDLQQSPPKLKRSSSKSHYRWIPHTIRDLLHPKEHSSAMVPPNDSHPRAKHGENHRSLPEDDSVDPLATIPSDKPDQPGPQTEDLLEKMHISPQQLKTFMAQSGMPPDAYNDTNFLAGSQRYLQFLAASAQIDVGDPDTEDEHTIADDDHTLKDTGYHEDYDDEEFDLRSTISKRERDHANIESHARRASVSDSVHESLADSVMSLAGLSESDAHSEPAGALRSESRPIEEVRRILEIPATEKVLDNYSAWFVEDVMIQGRFYATDAALYFLANLPLKSSNIIKAATLRKKTSRSVGYNRFWFVLRQNTFTYYTTASDVYFPSGTIDLSRALYARVELVDGKPSHTFTIATERKTYTLKADSSNSANEWAKALQKEIFRGRNQGNHVRIRIPWPNLIYSGFRDLGSLVRTARFAVVSDPKTLKVSDMIFAFFHLADYTVSGLQEFISKYGSTKAAVIGHDQELDVDVDQLHLTEPILNTTFFSGIQNYKISTMLPVSFNLPSQKDSYRAHDNVSTKEMLNTIISLPKGIVNVATQPFIDSDSKRKVDEPRRAEERPPSGYHLGPVDSTNGSSNVSSNVSASVSTATSLNNSAAPTASASPVITATDTKGMLPVPNLTSLADKVKELVDEEQEGDEASTDILTLTPSHSRPQSSEDVQESSERYREAFSFGPDVQLIASFFGHVMHNKYSVYGKLYISNEFLSFRKLGLGTEVRMIIPIDDITDVKPGRKNTSGYYVVRVFNQAYGSIVLDFGTKSIRADFIETLEDVRKDRIASQRDAHPKGDLPTEDEILTLNLRSARMCTYEQIVNSQMDIKIPPVMIDPLSNEANEYFLARPLEPLRITMLTIGSRGDVQPYIALSQGLMKEGHHCKIATHAEFKDFVEGYGIEFAEVAGNPKELMEIMIEHGSFSVAFLRDAASKFRGWVKDLLQSSWKACQDSDLLIESPSAMAGIHIAEALRIPYYRAFTMPWTRTRAYPHAFIVPEQHLGGSYNYFTYVMFDNLFWRGISGSVNSWRRKTLHLKATSLEDMKQQQVPFLYCVSPAVLVPPVDQPDWIHTTGYWFLENDKDHKVDPNLVSFIERARANNKKIVYIGFGSIVVSDPGELTRNVVDGVKKAGVYCVLAKGWSSRGQSAGDKKKVEVPLPDTIYPVDHVSHDWLFPQIDAAVHHGGSGTTGASLRHGLPTIIRPFFGDQFFYGHRVEDLGCGINLRRLTSDSLAKALLDATTDEKMISKAKTLGEQIGSEHGVSNAIYSLYREMSYARSIIKGRPAEPPGRPHNLRSTANSPTEELRDSSGHGPKDYFTSKVSHVWPSALNPFKHD